MTTKLRTIGDDLCLVIDPAMRAGLDIDQDTPLEVTTVGQGLFIRPARSDEQDLFLESAERMMTIHAETFRKLAQ